MSLLASTDLASQLGDDLRTIDPRAVVAIVALLVVGAVLSFIRKLIVVGLLLGAVAVVVFAYRAGAFDGVRPQVGL